MAVTLSQQWNMYIHVCLQSSQSGMNIHLRANHARQRHASHKKHRRILQQDPHAFWQESSICELCDTLATVTKQRPVQRRSKLQSAPSAHISPRRLLRGTVSEKAIWDSTHISGGDAPHYCLRGKLGVSTTLLVFFSLRLLLLSLGGHLR
jgi:hypothetical protein